MPQKNFESPRLLVDVGGTYARFALIDQGKVITAVSSMTNGSLAPSPPEKSVAVGKGLSGR